MTLGRTASGAIKIKTDGGLRAVECACCGGACNCNPPLTVKYKFTATSFSPIIGEQLWSACGDLVARTQSGHSLFMKRRCTNGSIPDWFDGFEIGAQGGDNFECGNLVAFVFGDSPVGTHNFYGNSCYDPEVECPCGFHGNGGPSTPQWTVTIAEDFA